MAKEIIYFDLETRKTAGDVGGWGNKSAMGISVAVTYSSKHNQYFIFEEGDSDALVEQLRGASLVVGFNHISFDYEVLMAHTVLDLKSQLASLDILVDIEKVSGHRPKLESVAKATLGVGKSADGMEAIRWWRQGRMLDIARYCCFDVKVTRMVYEYGARHGEVFYLDRNKRRQSVAVDWEAP